MFTPFNPTKTALLEDQWHPNLQGYVLLGEMLELGDGHEEGHERVGAAAAGVVDRLIVVGDGATGIARGARADRRPRLGDISSARAIVDRA